MQIQSPMRPPAQQSPPLGSRCLDLLAVITITRTTGFLSSPSAAEMRVPGNILCAYWSWLLAASPLSAPRRRAYLSLRRTEPDIRLKTRKQPSRPMHACEPAPWCYQNFTCPPSSCCRCSRQKINEAVTDDAGSGSCVARRGRFKRLRARKWETLLSDSSGRFPSTCIELAVLRGWGTQECRISLLMSQHPIIKHHQSPCN